MLFKRRNKLPFWRRLTDFVWPRPGFGRSGRYIWYRIVRLPDTPHRIAAGLASGAAVSFTPFLGLHILLGFLLAFITRGNMIAVVIGTIVGNPWTFPFMFTLTGEVGALLLGMDERTAMPAWSWDSFWVGPVSYMLEIFPALTPLIVGSIPIAALAWFLFYYGLKGAIKGYKAERKTSKDANDGASPSDPDNIVEETKKS